MSQANSSAIRLEQPSAGETRTIRIDSPRMTMALGFMPDPNNVEKNGQNLEFTFEDGGKIVLEGYYDHFATKTLPVMVTESGDELSGEDFLASLREDLLTAAGPGAGAAAGSGGSGDYSDDPGALVDGVGRLGSLGTIYWEGESETPDYLISALGTAVPTITITPIIPGDPAAPFVPGLPTDPGTPGTPATPGTPSTPGAPVYSMEGANLNIQVDESYMPNGTNYAGGDTPSQMVAFAIAGNDSLASVTINGVTYAMTATGLAGFTSALGSNGSLADPVLTTTEDGTLILTFTYTQGRPENHPGIDQKDMADNADIFDITVTGALGASASMILTVDIVDDIPIAHDDARSMEEIEESISGNVLADGAAGDVEDESGYDGWFLNPVQLLDDPEGVYGILTLNADGSYTYVRNSEGVPDEGGQDVFTYQVTDGDGDTTTATLTITLINTPPTANDPSGLSMVAETHDIHAVSGSDVHAAFLGLFSGPEDFVSMAFVNDPSAIAVSGSTEAISWSLVNGVWQGSVGGELALTVAITGWNADGTVTVTTTQIDPMTHTAGADQIVVSGIQVATQDAGGSAISAPITVIVHDDGPVAVADADAVTQASGFMATGNVLSNDDSGADGWAANAVTSAGTFQGVYGTLELSADGSYVYTLTAEMVPAGAREVFPYSVLDADNDAASSTLTITLPERVPAPTPDNLSTYTDDSALAETSMGAIGALANQNGGVSYTINASQLGDGWAFVDNLPSAPNGTLALVNGNLVYTQTSAFNHTDTDNNPNALEQAGVVSVPVYHAATNMPATVEVTINIYDDGPGLVIDPASMNVLGGLNNVVIGSWDFGMDDGSLAKIEVTRGEEQVAADVNGLVVFENGDVLSFNDNGTITFTAVPPPGTPEGGTVLAEGNFTIKVTDNDGDSVEKAFSYSSTAPTATISGATAVALNEAALADDGSKTGQPYVSGIVATVTGQTFTVTSDDPIKELLIGGTDVLETLPTITIIGLYTIKITGVDATDPMNVQVTYDATLLDNTTEHTAPTSGADYNSLVNSMIAIKATTALGAVAEGTLDVTVYDDVPTITAFTMTGASQTATASTFVFDLGIDPGADGLASVGIALSNLGAGITPTLEPVPAQADSYTVMNGNQNIGALSIANGKVTLVLDLVPEAGKNLEPTLSVTVTDNDGDVTQATANGTLVYDYPVSINLSNGGVIAMFDDSLRTGWPQGEPVHSSTLEDQTFTFTAGDLDVDGNPASATIVSGAQTIDLLDLASGSGITTDNGILTVTSVVKGAVNADGSSYTWTVTYDYELTAVQTHSVQGTDPKSPVDQFAIRVEDANGDQSTGTLTVNVTDDVPTAEADVRTMAETDISITGNVLTGLLADGKTASGDSADISGADDWMANSVLLTDATGGNQYGTLTLNTDGSYTYTRATGIPAAGAQEVYTYQVKDGDGDITTATLTITLSNTPPYINKEFATTGVTLALADKDAAGTAADSDTVAIDMFDGPQAFASVCFVAGTNPTVSGAQEVFTWELDNTGTIWTGTSAGGTEITVTLNSIGANGTVSISATLNDPAAHIATSDMITITGLNVVATDAGGSVTPAAAVQVTVSDDGSTAVADVRTMDISNLSITGNVFTGLLADGTLSGDSADTIGADGPGTGGALIGVVAGTAATKQISGLNAEIEGEYGTLTLNPDGSYTYKVKADHGIEVNTAEPVQDVFSYTIQDADGDWSTTTLTINVTNNMFGALTITVDEAGINDIGTRGTTGLEFSNAGVWESLFAAGSGLTIDESAYTLSNKIITIEGEYGVLRINVSDPAKPTYQYELTKAYQPAADGTDPLYNDQTDAWQNGVESFILKVKDGGNASGEFNVVVNVRDDIPSITFEDGGKTASFELGEQAGSVSLVFTAEGLLDRSYGADLAQGAEGDDAAQAEYITIEFRSNTIGADGNPTGWDENYNSITVNTSMFDVNGKYVANLGERGELVLSITPGGIAYTYIAKVGAKGDQEEIKLTVTDNDGDTDSVTLNVELNYPVPAGTALVDEAGLDTGSRHDGWLASSTDFSVLFHEDVTRIEWDITTIPSGVTADIGNGYEDVAWSQKDGVLTGSVDGTAVITVTPDIASGKATVDLLYPMYHDSDSGHNASLGLMLYYTGYDKNGSTTEVMNNAVHITVKDDYPLAANDVQIIAEPDTASYNVYLALDNSGSMYQRIGYSSYNSTETRMAAAIEAMTELVNAYVKTGADVRFTLLEFSSGTYAGNLGLITNASGSTTLTAQELLGHLEKHPISASGTTGGTDYGQLSKIQSKIGTDLLNTELQGWENKVYFISDGKPENGATPALWQSTMDLYGVDVITVGIDVESNSSAQTALKTVGNAGDDVINVSLGDLDYSVLTKALLDTMEPATSSGNLLDNDTSSADGMTLEYVTYGTVKYYFGGDGKTSAIELDNGLTITVGKNGEYTLVAKTNVEKDAVITGLTYTVKDGDGDYRTANVTITLQDAVPAAYDNVITPTGKNTGNILTDVSPVGQMDSLLDSAYLASISYNGTVYAFSGAAHERTITTDKGTLVIHGSGQYTFTPKLGVTDIDDVNFQYTLVDQDGDTASAWLYIRSAAHNITGSGEISGTGGNDVITGSIGPDTIHGNEGDDVIYGGKGDDTLFGDAGNDTLWGIEGKNLLDGGAGDDILYAGTGGDTLLGGAGDDILYGGTGNDTLQGGAGNDTLTGGDGNDTFIWTQEDLGAYRDVITDFCFEGDSKDIIDLSGIDNLRADDITVLVENGDLLLNIEPAPGVVQTIVIEGGSTYADATYTNLGSGLEAAQALVADMITVEMIKGVTG